MIEGELYALADECLLHQVIWNLLSNAAQALAGTAQPRVRLHAYARGDRVVVSVRDNGPGIAGEHMGKLFDPFWTTRRASGGTGLGLTLCREFVRRMGGEISVESVPGRGACFRVELPSAPEVVG
jgi:two-component system sensor histidine kinase PhcS